MPQHIKKELRNKTIRDIILSLVLFGVIIGLTLTRDKHLKECVDVPLKTWLLVMGCLEIVDCFRHGVVIYLLQTKPNPGPAKSKFDLAYACVVLTFKVAWLIYILPF